MEPSAKTAARGAKQSQCAAKAHCSHDTISEQTRGLRGKVIIWKSVDHDAHVELFWWLCDRVGWIDVQRSGGVLKVDIPFNIIIIIIINVPDCKSHMMQRGLGTI